MQSRRIVTDSMTAHAGGAAQRADTCEHMLLLGRQYDMMPHHERRTFGECVDFVLGVGYPGGLEGRRGLGMDRGGPEWVITPKRMWRGPPGRGRRLSSAWTAAWSIRTTAPSARRSNRERVSRPAPARRWTPAGARG